MSYLYTGYWWRFSGLKHTELLSMSQNGKYGELSGYNTVKKSLTVYHSGRVPVSLHTKNCFWRFRKRVGTLHACLLLTICRFTFQNVSVLSIFTPIGLGIYLQKNCMYKSYILNGDYKVSFSKDERMYVFGEERFGFVSKITFNVINVLICIYMYCYTIYIMC